MEMQQDSIVWMLTATRKTGSKQEQESGGHGGMC